MTEWNGIKVNTNYIEQEDDSIITLTLTSGGKENFPSFIKRKMKENNIDDYFVILFFEAGVQQSGIQLVYRQK